MNQELIKETAFLWCVALLNIGIACGPAYSFKESNITEKNKVPAGSPNVSPEGPKDLSFLSQFQVYRVGESVETAKPKQIRRPNKETSGMTLIQGNKSAPNRIDLGRISIGDVKAFTSQSIQDVFLAWPDRVGDQAITHTKTRLQIINGMNRFHGFQEQWAQRDSEWGYFYVSLKSIIVSFKSSKDNIDPLGTDLTYALDTQLYLVNGETVSVQMIFQVKD